MNQTCYYFFFLFSLFFQTENSFKKHKSNRPFGFFFLLKKTLNSRKKVKGFYWFFPTNKLLLDFKQFVFFLFLHNLFVNFFYF